MCIRDRLDNLRQRAEAHGGTLTVLPRTPQGTALVWEVLLERG